MTTSNGAILDASGNVAAIVHGYTGSALPAGQTFYPLADISQLVVGQAPPSESVQTLASTDHEMSRGVEDLIAVLIGKGTIVRTDLPPSLLTKINARRALRGSSLL